MKEAPRPLSTSFTEGAKNNTTFSESAPLISSMDTFNPSGAIFTEIEGEPEVQREADPSDSLSSIFWQHFNHPVSFRDVGWNKPLGSLWLVWDNSPIYLDSRPDSIEDSLSESLPKPPIRALKEYTGTETEYTEV